MNVVPHTPVGIFKILRNVPLDSTYTDTLNFSSVSAQQAYFNSKVKYPINDLGPVKMDNVIRIGYSADDLFDCNYVMFQNTNFGPKWFYAFITKIEYVNWNMCYVTIELDVMQTWMFDYELKSCFVEREHPNTDNAGDNLVPENLELGEYKLEEHKKTGLSNQSAIFVASTVDSNGENVVGQMYGHTYSGVQFYSFRTVDEVNNYLRTITAANKSDSIVAIFMANPTLFPTGTDPATVDFTIPKNLVQSFDGYFPRNKKLYTWPYNFLYCTNLQGNTAEFRYEFFESAAYYPFTLFGNATCNPTITLAPRGYKGTTGNELNLNEKMTLEGFPQCAYNIDTYKAWLAQNGAATAISVLGTAGGIAAGAATAAATGGASLALAGAGAIGGVASIGSTVAKVTATSAKPPQAKGSPGGSSLFDYGILDFHFYRCRITGEFAKIIDNYFDMFGYQTNEVKVPNVTGRPYWNYVKTGECKAVGSIPFTDMDKIKSIYNKGITFWHGDYVGDYSRNNSPS